MKSLSIFSVKIQLSHLEAWLYLKAYGIGDSKKVQHTKSRTTIDSHPAFRNTLFTT